MSYGYLMIAIAAEVIATSTLKATQSFTRPLPSIVVAVGYGVAFYCMTLCLESMQVGVVYALWSGLGIVLVALVGAILYRQIPDAAAIVGMTLIIAGALVMNLFSKTVTH